MLGVVPQSDVKLRLEELQFANLSLELLVDQPDCLFDVAYEVFDLLVLVHFDVRLFNALLSAMVHEKTLVADELVARFADYTRQSHWQKSSACQMGGMRLVFFLSLNNLCRRVTPWH